MRKLATVFRSYSERWGFLESDLQSGLFERIVDGLAQGFELVPRSGKNRGEFTINYFWRILASPLSKPGFFDTRQTLGLRTSGFGMYFPADVSIVDDAGFRCAFEKEVVEYFDRYCSLNQLVAGVENGVVGLG